MPKKKSSEPADGGANNERVAKRIKPASKLPKRFRALFYGRSGAGKTRLVSSAEDVLVLDINEEGTDSVRNDYDPHVYPVKFWQEINDVYWYLQSGEHPYKTVAIDGLTGMQDLCMKFVLGDEAARDASRDPDMPSRAVWLKMSELMKTQITNYRNLPMHVLFTALERKKATGDEDDEDLEIFTGPALSPAVASAAERAVGMIGYLSKQQVLAPRREGEKKRRRITRTRLTVDGTDKYLVKDRYHVGSPYVDGPNVSKLIEMIYGNKEA